jgi:peptide/nickel transport system substrate-binding protein
MTTSLRPFTIALEKVDFLAASRVTDDTSILTLKNLVLEPLCRWKDGRVGPGLLERWSHSDDGRIWHFDLRDGARFHDGAPCTAEDVVAFVEQIRTAVDTFGMPWPYARYLSGVELRAVAFDRLELVSPRSLGDIVDIFSEFYISRPDPQGRATIGTGPYRVSDFAAGREAMLIRIGEGTAPEHIRMVACADARERLQRVRDGACDAALNLERGEEPIAFDDDLAWQAVANTLSVMSYLDCTRGLFRSPAARTAINRAVDCAAIIASCLHGLAIPSSTVVSPFHLGFREARLAPIAYDADEAKRLFDLASVTEAIDPIVLRTPLSMPHGAEAITRAIGQMLEDIGLAVRIDIEPDRPSYARQIAGKAMGDSAIFDSSPRSTFRVLDDKISSQVRGTWWQGYANADVDDAIAVANRALGDAPRALAYARCLTELHRDPPWLYLFHPIEVVASRSGTPGLVLDHQGILDLVR